MKVSMKMNKGMKISMVLVSTTTINRLRAMLKKSDSPPK